MKITRKVRSIMAFILTVGLALGATSSITCFMTMTQTTAVAIDKAKYATAEQLSGCSTSDNGSVKIKLGVDSSGNDLTWYVLGADSAVNSGSNNTIIFATGKAVSAVFSPYYQNKYSTSNLLSVLKQMGDEVDGGGHTSQNFTTAELALLNQTTVSTKNDSDITAKLYAPAGVKEATSISVGSGDGSVALDKSIYWNTGSYSSDWVWLRSPDDSDSNCALVAEPRYIVRGSNTVDEKAVHPASNLNLSSVLFASAAPTATSAAAAGLGSNAMVLRLSDNSQKIGTATYNPITGKIFAKCTSEDEDSKVYLIVQGKSDSADWYYSKEISGSELQTIDVSGIKDTLVSNNVITSEVTIKLSDCKIWLEKTVSTDRLTYAVNATVKYDYDIIDGANSTWTKGSESGLTIIGNGIYDNLSSVCVDSETIETANYTAASGSTVITLTPEYLNTLSVGSHTFQIVWSDNGTADTTFTIAEATAAAEQATSVSTQQAEVSAPQTGDENSVMLWGVLTLASAVGLVFIALRKKMGKKI